jgi:hypothetical protein
MGDTATRLLRGRSPVALPFECRCCIVRSSCAPTPRFQAPAPCDGLGCSIPPPPTLSVAPLAHRPAALVPCCLNRRAPSGTGEGRGLVVANPPPPPPGACLILACCVCMERNARPPSPGGGASMERMTRLQRRSRRRAIVSSGFSSISSCESYHDQVLADARWVEQPASCGSCSMTASTRSGSQITINMCGLIWCTIWMSILRQCPRHAAKVRGGNGTPFAEWVREGWWG